MTFIDLYSRARSALGLKKAWSLVHEAARLTPEQAIAKDMPMPLALATVRAAAEASLGLRPFDVQLLGAVLLSQGKLAEMQTGEGKTLTVALGAALLASRGRKVHVATANEYLATRDAALMAPFYAALGLTCATVSESLAPAARRAAYDCDVVYSTGSELGFDYLKNNLVLSADERTQGTLDAVIVDEVDSILIDDARTPLIISGQAQDHAQVFAALVAATQGLQPDVHYRASAKERYAELVDAGYALVESRLIAAGHIQSGEELYRPEMLHWAQALHSIVKARALYRPNRDYLVKDGKVQLVDLGTGRVMDGRRLEAGLHEALEALEGLSVQAGTVTRATITYQSFFRKYAHLCGLTGTAATESEEFLEMYGLEVVVVPTNKPSQRVFHEDLVYLTKAEKLRAAADLVKLRTQQGQPVLVGCSTVRDAEAMSSALTQLGIAHNLLTAKHVEREAHIIAEAGLPGAVTVATNMAGRGTDILLGGPAPEKAAFASPSDFDEAQGAWRLRREITVAAGGLFVLGTDRNGLRRVDLQLAGRAGRQGDPGEIKFLISLEDELLKTFGDSPALKAVKAQMTPGVALGGQAISRIVSLAQKRVEEMGFAARKHLLRFESVFADQRDTVYALRNHILDALPEETVRRACEAAAATWLDEVFPANSIVEELDQVAIREQSLARFGLRLPILRWVSVDELEPQEMRQKAEELLHQRIEEVMQSAAAASLRDLVLSVLDGQWQAHLGELSEMQENLGLKGHLGASPLHQFGTDAFSRLEGMLNSVNAQVAELVLATEVLRKRAEATAAEDKVKQAWANRWIGRNDKCPCESGLRYKDCHGSLA